MPRGKKTTKKTKKEKTEEIKEVKEIKEEEKVEETPVAVPNLPPSEIFLEENEILKFRLIFTQFNVVKKSIENLDLQKQMMMTEQETVKSSLSDVKDAINKKYSIVFDDYGIDLENGRLVRKS